MDMILDFRDRCERPVTMRSLPGHRIVPDAIVDRLYERVTSALCSREREMRQNIRQPRPGNMIVTVDQGGQMRDLVFDQAPSVRDLVERAGAGAVVVTMRPYRPSLRERLLSAGT
jgi:hypothetical protein